MNIWKGLLMKEWLLMRGWTYVTLIFTGMFTFFIPIFITLYFSVSVSQFNEGFNALSIFWFMAILFIPAIILMVSLGKEAERSDIWLHSPNSIFTLFGVKVFFAGLIGMLNLLLSAFFLMLLFSVKLQPYRLVFEGDTLYFWLLFLPSLFIISIIIMCIGLLFRVIYLVMRPRTKKLTSSITFVSLFLFIWVSNKIIATEIYQKVSKVGKIGSVSESYFYLGDESSYLWVDESLFYLGEIILSFGYASLLFIAASLLFERKVRL